MSRQEIGVATASVLEGWTIDDYRGLVASQIVAGTGLFSDIAAGFSDIFGGRSESYQRQLDSIRSEVLDQLKEGARRVGANWIIGVRLDFDEISGKGAQMFMVSAQGTAVSARRIKVEGPSDQHTDSAKSRSLSPGEVSSGVTRNILVQRATDNSLTFDDATWSELARLKVVEAVHPVVAKYARGRTHPDHASHIEEKAIRFLSSLPETEASASLHDLVDEGSHDTAAAALHFIATLSLLDLAWVKDRICSDDLRLRHAALQLLNSDPPYYGPTSLGLIEEILAILPTAFPERPEIRHKKRILGKDGEVWVCAQGHESEMSLRRCVCGYDKRGLYREELTPEDAADLLRQRLAVLSQHF